MAPRAGLRTSDPAVNSRLLYRLSYRGTLWPRCLAQARQRGYIKLQQRQPRYGFHGKNSRWRRGSVAQGATTRGFWPLQRAATAFQVLAHCARHRLSDRWPVLVPASLGPLDDPPWHHGPGSRHPGRPAPQQMEREEMARDPRLAGEVVGMVAQGQEAPTGFTG